MIYGLSLNCKRYAWFPHINEPPSSVEIALNVGDDKETRLNDRTRINLLPTLICNYVQDCMKLDARLTLINVLPKAREKSRVQGAIALGFAFYWLKKWHEFS